MVHVSNPSPTDRTRPRIGVVVGTDLAGLLFSEADRARLEALAEVRWCESATPPSVEEAIGLLDGGSIGVGSWRTPRPTTELLEACPDLRLWVHAAGSVKAIVDDLPEHHDLTVASCAPAIAANVAEYTVGLLIVGLKRTLENAAANRENDTTARKKPANAIPLASATVGVVGASQVGRRVIEFLRPFGGRTLIYDPFLDAAAAAVMGAEKIDDLTELCRRSHAVTLHTPDLPATRKMMGAAQFAAMRDDAVLINTARGACLDEAALIEQLAAGRFFAYLDVSDPEPAADDSPLRSLPNVVLNTHIAGGGDFKIGRQVVDDVAAFLDGRPPAMAVTPDMLDRLA